MEILPAFETSDNQETIEERRVAMKVKHLEMKGQRAPNLLLQL